MVAWLFKLAAIYLLWGVGLGIYMYSTHNGLLRPVHVHANLLGWATLALTALAYHIFPRMLNSKLADWHFWLHNLGLPVALAGLTSVLLGHVKIGGPFAGLGSIAAALGLLLFAINLWKNSKV